MTERPSRHPAPVVRLQRGRHTLWERCQVSGECARMHPVGRCCPDHPESDDAA